jgi:hypothetical protein
MIRRPILLAAFVCCIVVGAPLHAATIINSFGPNGTFNDLGVSFELFDGQVNQELLGFGPSFTPSENSFLLDQISLPVTVDGAQLKVALMADDSGQPGKIIEAFNIDGVGSNPTVYTLNSALHPPLRQDEVYWLIGFITSENLNAFWYGYPTNASGLLAHGPYSDGHWLILADRFPAFSVTGIPVPEPSYGSFVYTALCCFILLLVQGRRSRTPSKGAGLNI